MSDVSANLSMPYIQPSQAQKHVTHNEALRQLDALVQLSVQSATQSAPPPAPTDGDRFLLPAGSTGSWAGNDGKIAVFQESTPKRGAIRPPVLLGWLISSLDTIARTSRVRFHRACGFGFAKYFA